MPNTLVRLEEASRQLDVWPVDPAEPVRPTVVAASDLTHDVTLGHYRKGHAKFLHHNKKRSLWRHNVLVWLRDHVSEGIPRAYYNLVLGHDLHISTWAELYARQFHYNQLDPFTGKLEYHNVEMRGVLQSVPGWWENLGLFSRDKVTDAFVSFEIDTLVLADTEYADFKFHRVGTSAAVEDNNQTALTTDSEITGATGSQVDADPIYRSVGTVTADVTEDWEEHGLFSQAGTTVPAGTMMDRSSTGSGSFTTVSVILNDTVEFTYELTKNPEA